MTPASDAIAANKVRLGKNMIESLPECRTKNDRTATRKEGKRVGARRMKRLNRIRNSFGSYTPSEDCRNEARPKDHVSPNPSLRHLLRDPCSRREKA